MEKYLTEKQIVKKIYGSKLDVIDSVVHCGLNSISFYSEYCGKGSVTSKFTLNKTNRITEGSLILMIEALADEN